ncbi:regulator of G-protein signaling loco-like isoform X4 [Scylla paramamosain]|uniref:regulator of G-protein signaling loco-like isoform X4 n=1 Tax=Scylla paramamosain TaxID=85552 RepID=UPI003082BC04
MVEKKTNSAPTTPFTPSTPTHADTHALTRLLDPTLSSPEPSKLGRGGAWRQPGFWLRALSPGGSNSLRRRPTAPHAHAHASPTRPWPLAALQRLSPRTASLPRGLGASGWVVFKILSSPPSGPPSGSPSGGSSAPRREDVMVEWVDGGGGGGEGKKWIANRSLQRHYPEHCVDPSLSDTELGKISTPHSLLDGECVSVGGSSMTSERAIDVGRVGTWASSFEKLLEDPAGLHTFAEFLKKEYSHENIYFWTACERYKRLTSPDELRSTARQIFERHLYSGAPEPVNVDSQARQDAQDGLHLPNESLFAQAQKQIFNLMKFDSYSRFLKSALYQDCLTQEMRGQPLPYAGDDALDPDLRIGAEDSHVKLKKSRSDADERRRKSLLPWNRKDRSKSKDRGEAEYRRRKKNTLRNTSDSSSLRSDVSGSRTSLNSSDLPLGRRVASRESLTSGDQGSLSGGEGSARCRVVLPDLTNSVVAIKGSETVQEVMGRLLERRGLSYSTFEVYHHKTDKLLNKKEDSSILGGCEVRLEQRVFFQLDLPSQKVVCIKAKPAKTTGEVLKPILQKYGLKIDLLHIHRDGEERPVNLKAPVTDIDGMKLVVQTKEEVKGQVRSAEVGSGQVRSGQVKLDMIVREGMKRRIDEF